MKWVYKIGIYMYVKHGIKSSEGLQITRRIVSYINKLKIGNGIANFTEKFYQ